MIAGCGRHDFREQGMEKDRLEDNGLDRACRVFLRSRSPTLDAVGRSPPAIQPAVGLLAQAAEPAAPATVPPADSKAARSSAAGRFFAVQPYIDGGRREACAIRDGCAG